MLKIKNGKANYDSNGCMQCGVCLSTCPKHALTVQKGSTIYTINIDKNKCIGCGLCQNVCPSNYITKDRINWEKLSASNAYLTWSKDEKIQYESSSGGTVRSIAKEFLETTQDSFVFALADYNNGAKLLTLKTIDKMPNSVYAPTMWGRNLEQLNNIPASSKVMLIGLPCQIKGAKKYIEIKHLKFHTTAIAIICRKTKNFKFTEYIRKFHNLNKEDFITYRGYGWPGIIGNKDKGNSLFAEFCGIPFGLDLWNVKGCYRCADCIAQNDADITIGDPWNIRNNSVGCNYTLFNNASFAPPHKLFNSIEYSELSNSESQIVVNPSMVANKINRVRFYTGVDKGLKVILKYMILELKSNITGFVVEIIGHTSLGKKIAIQALHIDSKIKNLFK